MKLFFKYVKWLANVERPFATITCQLCCCSFPGISIYLNYKSNHNTEIKCNQFCYYSTYFLQLFFAKICKTNSQFVILFLDLSLKFMFQIFNWTEIQPGFFRFFNFITYNTSIVEWEVHIKHNYKTNKFDAHNCCCVKRVFASPTLYLRWTKQL